MPQLSTQIDTVESAHLFIDDEITAGKVTANGFCEALRQTRAKTVHVHIDSNGGSVPDGLAIYDALISYPGEVVVHVDGLCGSICPVIAMAGRRILMAGDAVMLVHHTSATISGTFPEILATARGMAVHEVKMMNALTSRSGASVERILSVMKSERPLNAHEALELGLCTEIVPEKGLACTWDFQGVVQSTDAIVTAIANYRRTWSRVPKSQTIPTGYLFQAPNFPRVDWGNTSLPPAGACQISGAYAVIALNTCPPLSSSDMAAITGYYDQQYAISGYSGTPDPTSLTVVGNNFHVGDRLIFQVYSPGVFYYFTVNSVSGSTIGGTPTRVADESSVADFFTNFVDIVVPLNKCRRQTRNDTDTGQTVMLPAQQIDEFYLPGVSRGISSVLDIPNHQPFQLTDYLAAWAGNATWFNVQASQIQQWHGPILKASYTQAALSAL